MTGRPSKYTPEIAAEVCERLSRGEPLAKICRDDHIPSDTTIRNWMADDEALSSAIARARISGFDYLASECLEIAEERPERTPAGSIDSGSVQHAKLRIETRLKLLAKWDPKRYGEKLELSGDSDNPLVTKSTIDVSGLSTQALAELMALRDASNRS
jgi:hypothetical protein